MPSWPSTMMETRSCGIKTCTANHSGGARMVRRPWQPGGFCRQNQFRSPRRNGSVDSILGTMSRPPAADVARSKRLHIRFTPAEMEMIEERAGAVGKTAIEWARLWLLEPHLEPSAPSASPAKPKDPPAPVASDGAKPHRHRRVGEPIRVKYEYGVAVPLYQCYGCDKELR